MEIKLYNDIAFKWIFGRQSRTAPLLDLINTVLSHEEESALFSDVLVLNPYDASEPFKNEKQGILDIRAKDKYTDQWFDLEMQVKYSEVYPQRSKYYLAGLYRDQLEKDKKVNYCDLNPVYGIHLLLENLFREESDKDFWFNHYTMLNTRSHVPLTGHWHLYYIELQKCLEKLSRGEKGRKILETPLEQWAYFLANPQDNEKPLDPALKENQGIVEVYDMLQTFTKEDHLREQYRLREEFLRTERTEALEYQRMTEKYQSVLKDKKAVQKQWEIERRAKEAALKAKEAAFKEREQEKKAKESAVKQMEKFKYNSILKLKQQGISLENISDILSIPMEEVQSLLNEKLQSR
ncbi:MAG: PD-(D/E)XK nuclease family transposase [Desulfamplus sp.]|nr:PD-(D/E)XK nuclease family transposase [Desulfamplus sp.]